MYFVARFTQKNHIYKEFVWKIATHWLWMKFLPFYNWKCIDELFEFTWLVWFCFDYFVCVMKCEIIAERSLRNQQLKAVPDDQILTNNDYLHVFSTWLLLLLFCIWFLSLSLFLIHSLVFTFFLIVASSSFYKAQSKAVMSTIMAQRRKKNKQKKC